MSEAAPFAVWAVQARMGLSARTPPSIKDRRTWIAITCGVGAVGGVATARCRSSPASRLRSAPVPPACTGAGRHQRHSSPARSSPSSGVASQCGSYVARPSRWPALKKLDGRARRPEERPQGSIRPPPTRRIQHRSIKPEYFVGVGICSHLGCSPVGQVPPPAHSPRCPTTGTGGFLCPCHGSTFDLAGRVFKNKPAPDNLEVPPHMYLVRRHWC